MPGRSMAELEDELDLITDSEAFERLLQRIAGEDGDANPDPDPLRLELTVEEVALVLASISNWVMVESARLQDLPRLRETLVSDATSVIRKIVEAQDA